MKKIIVLGGSSGIGYNLTNQLLDSGHSVFATYCKNKIEKNHPNLTTSFFDIQLTDNFEFELPEQIDGFVYCPGTINLKPFRTLKKEDFQHEFDINLLGFIKTLQLLLKPLKKSENASVVGFSSVCAQSGFNFHASTATSKAALEGLFVSLAKEYSPKISFNLIAPSIIQTSLSSHLLNTKDKIDRIASTHPIPRIGQPKDVASLAHFLLTESSWMTGQIIKVDGGKSSLL
jgi:NAD(P)-dependent dehydrogenase (short-subunit alcohol dehydrogenase family)